MDKWRKAIDQQLQSAIGDGDVSQLPGAGSPLRLDDDSYAPADMRAANKIMRDHNVTPAWVQNGKALDEREEQLRKQIKDAAKRYMRGKGRANPAQAAAAEKAWRRSQADFLERLSRFNRDILTHNLSAPRGLPHRLSLHGEALINDALKG